MRSGRRPAPRGTGFLIVVLIAAVVFLLARGQPDQPAPASASAPEAAVKPTGPTAAVTPRKRPKPHVALDAEGNPIQGPSLPADYDKPSWARTGTPARKPDRPRLEIGGEVTIGDGEGVRVFLATDDRAWDEMHQAVAAKDYVGLRQLMAASRVHLIPDGTRAKLIEAGFLSHKVRILEGSAKDVAGWVATEHVHPR